MELSPRVINAATFSMMGTIATSVSGAQTLTMRLTVYVHAA